MYKVIEVFENKTGRRVAQYMADNSMSSPTKVTLFKDGAEAGVYSPTECYHTETPYTV